MAKIKVVSRFDGDILEWGRVVWGDRGQPFVFQVSKFGTNVTDQVETEIGDMDKDRLKELIEAEVGVVRKNNPVHADVTTDSDGDGVSDKVDAAGNPVYGWCQEGQLYTCTFV